MKRIDEARLQMTIAKVSVLSILKNGIQHVGDFAETSGNRIAITFFESFPYTFLITFCRGADLIKTSQNASQNEASGHPKSQHIKNTEHSKKHLENIQKVGFRIENDIILGLHLSSPEPPQHHKRIKNLQTQPPDLQNDENLNSDLQNYPKS